MALGSVGTTTRTVHMRATYFSGPPTMAWAEAAASINPPGVSITDVARALRQLELLVKYATLVQQRAPTASGADISAYSVLLAALAHLPRVASGERSVAEPSSGDDVVEAKIIEESVPLRESGLPTHPLAEWPGLVPLLPQLSRVKWSSQVLADVAPKSAEDQVSVISIEMRSPLTAVLEIPPTLWPVLGGGLLLLVERIATAPVRIARKQKEELLKIAALDQRIRQAQAGRADGFSDLLREEGPRGSTGPTEVIFVDPDDPNDELETISATG